MDNKKFWKSILFIFIFIVLNLFMGIINYIFKLDNNNLFNIFGIIEEIFILFIFILITKVNLKKEFKEFKKDYIPDMFKYWLLGFVLLGICNAIIGLLVGIDTSTNEELNRKIIHTYPVYAVIAMCITAPMIEELIFRYSFKDTFKSNKTYAIVTGVIFGAMHVLLSMSSLKELLFIIPYSTLGIALGVIFKKCNNNFFSTFFVHAFHNTLSILLIFLLL